MDRTRTTAIAVALALGVAAPAAAAPSPGSFRLADGSVGCAFAGGAVACRGAAAVRGISLAATGAPRPAGAVAWTTATPVLREGATWSRAGIACRAARAAITCTNRSASSITVRRAGFVATIAPVVVTRP